MSTVRNAGTMGVRQAAQELGVTLKYVYDLIYSRKLDARKVGRQWRISKQALDRRLKKQECLNA